MHSKKESRNLKEIKNLVDAAGYTIVSVIEQVRKPDSRFLVGRGKIEEIAKLVKENEVKRLIFDNRLKSVQIYNIAKKTGVEVIDRFQLILEVFTHRASTAEAKLQIQLAKLRYELAHAKEKVRLARLGEQPGFMGLGSYEVEPYYDSIKKQVNAIKNKLKKIKKKRSLHRKRRKELGFLSVSLAGYTCAGKSTLFNSLAKETVPTGKGLFTTLSTTTRLMKLYNKQVLLTDTVGFIERLPIDLIDAFRSTLEETVFSDLIILVVDASEPSKTIKEKLSVCFDTIEKIGAYGIPLLLTLNKIDLLPESEIQQKSEIISDIITNIVPISAIKGENIDTLKLQLSRLLGNEIQVTISLPANDETLSFISWIFNHAYVKNVAYETEQVRLTFEADSKFTNIIINRVRDYGGSFNSDIRLAGI